MTERLHFHFSLSCTGEGNGNPPQCSCLENPRDRGPWWAAIYGVAQSRTRLKWLSSSSSVCAHACVCVLSSYPFLCWWAFRLIPCLGYCKQCGNEYWGAFILWDHVFLQHILNHLITFRAAAAAASFQSCPTLCDPIDDSPPGSRPWDSPGKNTGVGCHFLLQCTKVKSESEVA